jgi:hypothetical protein
MYWNQVVIYFSNMAINGNYCSGSLFISTLTCVCNNSGAIRAEFLGEEGVGLGPTLEYFTLVSHGIQRRDLSLWRDEKNDMEAPDEDKASIITTMDTNVDSKAGSRDASPARTHHHYPQSSTQPPSRLGSPPKIDPTLPPDVDPARAMQFHRIGVMRCKKCRVLTIPHCQKHGQLLSRRQHDGSWSCSGAHGRHGHDGTATTATATISTRGGRKRKEKTTPLKLTVPSSDSKQHSYDTTEQKPSSPDQQPVDKRRRKADTATGSKRTTRSSKAVDDTTTATPVTAAVVASSNRPRTRSVSNKGDNTPIVSRSPERKRRNSRSAPLTTMPPPAPVASLVADVPLIDENVPAPAARTRSRTAAAATKGGRCTPLFACLSSSSTKKKRKKVDPDSPPPHDDDDDTAAAPIRVATGAGTSAPIIAAAAAAASAPIATPKKVGRGRRGSRSTSRSRKKGKATTTDINGHDQSPSRSVSISSIVEPLGTPCSYSTHDIEKACDCCGGDRETREWIFSKEEASYLYRSYPKVFLLSVFCSAWLPSLMLYSRV